MKILDTNVVSELLRPNRHENVVAWVDAQPLAELFLTAITEAELHYGVAKMPNGKRKKALEADVDAILKQEFAGRILPFDSNAAIEYAAIVSTRRALGKPISQFDAQIAAIARANGAAAIVTRNVEDFAGVGVEIVNPWETH
jgi:toxin FitB